MSKKRKERSELEHLRGENRKLQSQLRDCQKHLRQTKKWANLPIEDEEDEPAVPIVPCPECSKGNMHYVDLHLVKYWICDVCKFRRKK